MIRFYQLSCLLASEVSVTGLVRAKTKSAAELRLKASRLWATFLEASPILVTLKAGDMLAPIVFAGNLLFVGDKLLQETFNSRPVGFVVIELFPKCS